MPAPDAEYGVRPSVTTLSVGSHRVICPFCASTEHRVVESRVPDSKDAIRRRRECTTCGRRFTTYERVEEMPLVVVKASGEREAFERGKLFAGLHRACHKRQVPVATLEVAVRDIEAELRNSLKHEVRSASIGELALRRLKEIDRVAYIRVASVYRAFEDVDEFSEELNRLEREPPLPREQGRLDDHMFDTIGASSGRGRLRALRGGKAEEPVLTREEPDGD